MPGGRSEAGIGAEGLCAALARRNSLSGGRGERLVAQTEAEGSKTQATRIPGTWALKREEAGLSSPSGGRGAGSPPLEEEGRREEFSRACRK